MYIVKIAKHSILQFLFVISVLSTQTVSAQDNNPDRFNRLPFATSPIPTDRPIDSSATFYELLDDADMVLSAEILSVEGRITDDVFSEMYTLMRVGGLVATANGTSEIPRDFLLRVTTPWSQKEIEGSQYILFVKNNLQSYNPIRRAFPVKEGVVYHNIFRDKPLLLVDSMGEIKTSSGFNSCDISEYNEIYNPSEALENVVSFTCANGSQWNKGNERPDDYVDQVMTSSALLATASLYMNRNSIPDPVLTISTPDTIDKPLRRESQLTELSAYRDEIFRRYIAGFDRTSWAKMSQIPPKEDRRMIDFVKREIARGKTPSEFPENIKGFSEVLESDRAGRIRYIQEANNVNRTRRVE